MVVWGAVQTWSIPLLPLRPHDAQTVQSGLLYWLLTHIPVAIQHTAAAAAVAVFFLSFFILYIRSIRFCLFVLSPCHTDWEARDVNGRIVYINHTTRVSVRE